MGYILPITHQQIQPVYLSEREPTRAPLEVEKLPAATLSTMHDGYGSMLSNYEEAEQQEDLEHKHRLNRTLPIVSEIVANQYAELTGIGANINRYV
ncbi:hypothetical protein SAMN04488134_108104 [Amphibacillus marinus]|uniref:Uncharacterized protein n=1 Tax=Amphibacillus marinus TaxID=872970 RepID=A0A1H8QAY8_9BACI|nr:hypothetical protein [Amphibacillus marinus]SEO51390.1 hypothetical protein SAMN04488134_108104 [Amphibacillus marinus]